jgi:hypothetical protein
LQHFIPGGTFLPRVDWAFNGFQEDRIDRRVRDKSYDQPTGGRSSVKSLGQHAIEQSAVTTAGGLKKDHNKVGGYGCTSCARVAGLILVSVACDDGCEVFVESLDA